MLILKHSNHPPAQPGQALPSSNQFQERSFMLRATGLPLTCRPPPPSHSPTRPGGSWTAECRASRPPPSPGSARRELPSPPTRASSPASPMDPCSSTLSPRRGGGATCTTAWWGARLPTCTAQSSPPWSTSREVRSRTNNRTNKLENIFFSSRYFSYQAWTNLLWSNNKRNLFLSFFLSFFRTYSIH